MGIDDISTIEPNNQHLKVNNYKSINNIFFNINIKLYIGIIFK